jgi:hypothetical protein
MNPLPTGWYKSNPTYGPFSWTGIVSTGTLKRLYVENNNEVFFMEYLGEDVYFYTYKITFKSGIVTGNISKDNVLSNRVLFTDDEEEVI